MYFMSNGSIVIAWQFNHSGSKWPVNGVDYDGKMRLAMISATDTTAATWLHVFDKYFGRSASLTVIEEPIATDSAIFVGGAVDNYDDGVSDPINTVEWSPSLFQVQYDGTEQGN